VPIAQPGQGGIVTLTIQFREFGIRLNFFPEIVSDSLIKLTVSRRSRAWTLRTPSPSRASASRRFARAASQRRSTSGATSRSSLSGLFNDEREQVRTGIPFLMDIPILGALFGNSSWTSNQSELLILVTPTVFNPMSPPARRCCRSARIRGFRLATPIEKRLPPPVKRP
jgi:Flp pilus assembly secretin CpaC